VHPIGYIVISPQHSASFLTDFAGGFDAQSNLFFEYMLIFSLANRKLFNRFCILFPPSTAQAF
jgi:hypothetical protein